MKSSIPHCDLSTGKIYGCKKGSRVWWHEKGHFKFNKLESTSRLLLYQGYAFKYWMTFTTLSLILIVKTNNSWISWLFIIPSLFFFLSWLAIDVYEELWCWWYANTRLKKY
jgi:hypothetical protein